MEERRARWGDLVVDERARRQEIRRRHRNGLDTLEVDHGGRRLVLTFLEQAPGDVHAANVRVDGPSGAAAVTVTEVRREAPDDARVHSRILVELASPGGPGGYTLRLVEQTAAGRPGWAPLRGLDPRFAQVEFAFDIDLTNPVPATAPSGASSPADLQASYLARDYQGLRQLLLDRLTTTMPAWTERHVPDIGITLVELLAFIGDDLSYYQDAVATEAYLQTARRRISVRRHARLVDYRLGEGCQARAWVCLTVSAALELPLRDVVFQAAPGAATGSPAALSGSGPSPGTGHRYTPVRAALGPPGPGSAPGRGPTVTLSPAHNQVPLWAWGAADSRLAAGATTAILADTWTDPTDHGPSGPRALGVQAGDVVVFEAVHAPDGIGSPDPALRHPVRLTAVHPSVDRLYEQPILEIGWAPADALPFDLQVTAPAPAGPPVACAVVSANTVLVGDGIAVTAERHPGNLPVPAATTNPTGSGSPTAPMVLTQPGLTWACPYPDPVTVAAHQAAALLRLPGRWRETVEDWRHEAAGGQALDARRRTRLRRLLGQDVLTRFGLGDQSAPEDRQYPTPRQERDHDDEDGDRAGRDADGLRRLLLEADRLLAPRVRRLGLLSALATASGPLDLVLLREVADDWGPDLAATLSPHHPAGWGPAAAATSQDPGGALPGLSLSSVPDAAGTVQRWSVAADVVDSPPGSHQVMVEVDDDQLAHLRFSPGDRPTGPVEATYQVGQGAGGNLPAEAINALVPLTPAATSAVAVVTQVRNPLPATGGTDPQTLTAAKAAIPGAFLIHQPRALVAADYTAIAERVPGVRRAATLMTGTGTGYAAQVAVQPAVGEGPDPQVLAAVERALAPVRRLGHDVWVSPPHYRFLRLALSVDLGPDVLRADITDALAGLLSSGVLPDGTPALFHPARMGFGQPVYASPIVAAVQDVPGVEGVELTRFGFLTRPGASYAAATGPTAAQPIAAAPNPPPPRLRLRPQQIARLDNDPAAPQHGHATVTLNGGR